jgi:antitoxin (DNA-binding transcriptional repressor) of toxin-antitoxin stability system
MYHMKSVSIRDLSSDSLRIEEMLRAGETIRLTRNRRVFARLVPDSEPESTQSPVKWPDFAARRKAIFGDRCLEVTGAEIVAMDRDRY